MDADASASELPRAAGHERASLNYIQWKDDFKTEKPYEIISQVPEGCPQKNFTLVSAPEQVIRNIRGREGEFSLENNGFEVRKHEISMPSFEQGDIEEYYLPAVKALLQEVDPGAEVFIFDWRVRPRLIFLFPCEILTENKLRTSDRSRTRHDEGARIDLDDPTLVLSPVHVVHNGSSQQDQAHGALSQDDVLRSKRPWRHQKSSSSHGGKGRKPPERKIPHNQVQCNPKHLQACPSS